MKNFLVASSNAKPNLPFLLYRLLTQFVNRLEYDLEFPVVSKFKFFDAFIQFLVIREHLSDSDESSHYLDIDLHGSFASKHATQHCDSLFGEGIRRVARPSAV